MPDEPGDPLELPEEARRTLEELTAAGVTGKVGIHVSKGRIVAVTFVGNDQSRRFIWGDADALRGL